MERKNGKNLKKMKRETGASLPEDLRSMYKEDLYNKSKQRLEEYPGKMKENIELRKQQEDDFKEKIKVLKNPDHEMAKKQADKKQQQSIEKQVYYILDEYIKENNLKGNNVMTNMENEKVTLAYTNEKGEIIRKEFTVQEVLNMKKKEIVE